MLVTLLALQVLAASPPVDPFAFFQPSVAVTDDDRRQLDGGQPIARVLPGTGLEVAVFAAVPVNIDGDRLVAWIRRIEELKKSTYVEAIGRFSNTPRIEDVSGLALDDDELPKLRTCRPGACALKLSAREMTDLQRAAAGAGNNWQPAVQQAFRRVVLARVQAYLTDGHVPPYEDGNEAVWPAARFAALLEHSGFLTARLPRFAEGIRHGPSAAAPDVESFLYWSKERLATKAIVSVTQVSILRSHDPALPEVLVVGKEIFGTHYVNASLGVTALMRGESAGSHYLVYINRSEVDMLGGMFGGLIRWFIQRRLRAEAATVLQGLRRRLEGGEPPPLSDVRHVSRIVGSRRAHALSEMRCSEVRRMQHRPASQVSNETYDPSRGRQPPRVATRANGRHHRREPQSRAT